MQRVWHGLAAMVFAAGWAMGQAPETSGAEEPDAVEHADIPAYRLGLDALSGRLWEVAAARFEEALEAGELAEEARREILLRLAEARVRGGKPAAAREILDRPGLAAHPEREFWRAQALVAEGRFAEAIAILEARPDDAPFWRESRLTRAELRRALGDSAGALKTLGEALARRPEFAEAGLLKAEILLGEGRYREAIEAVPETDELDPRQRAIGRRLRARSHLGLGEAARAAELFSQLTGSPENQSLSDFHANVIDLARARLDLGERESAADSLLAFIQQNPESPRLTEAFDVLHECLPAEPAPNDPILSRLREWIPARRTVGIDRILGSSDRAAAGMPGPYPSGDRLAPQALYHLALGMRRQPASGTAAAARRLLTRLRWEYPGHPLFFRALLRLGQWDLEDGNAARAGAHFRALAGLGESAPAELRAQAMSLEAATLFERGAYEEAAAYFQRAAALLGADLRRTARRNAAAALLAAGDIEGFGEIAAGTDDDELRVALALERALHLGAVRDPEALPRLLEFIENHPDHPRVAEARLSAALAALDHTPAKVAVAERELGEIAAADRRKLAPDALALAEIRLRQRQRDWAGAAERAGRFLEAHPDSPSRTIVSFEQGKAHFQNKDFNDARLVLEALVEEAPESPQAPAALLLAARAAAEGGTPQSQKESLELFDRLIESDSEFAAVARLEKADLHIRLTQLDEAVDLLGPWFDAMNEDDPMLLVAGLLLGDALVASAEGEPGGLGRALEVFDRILAGRAAGSLTRHRVLYQKGLVLEQLEGRTDEALKTYMDVVQRAAGSSRGDWKAVELCGFGALRILEKRGEWRAAKQLAERIARLGGPRAEEAAERAKTLGLEHFIWDE
jgi:tetratricopeptide (TPR) repeat protein